MSKRPLVDAFDEVTIQRVFGHEAAEDEAAEELRRYYFKSDVYDKVAAALPLRILVGHKGIGKSALFRVSYLEDEQVNDLAVWIRPDDLQDMSLDADDLLSLIRQWKAGLSKIIVGKILDKVGYERKDLTDATLGYGAKVAKYIADTFIKETVADLTATNKAILNKYLQTRSIKVYIDDLDRGWRGSASDISRISALLNALRDLSNDNPGLRFKVALRSDVYFLVRTSDESTDKIEGSVVWHTWNNHQILALLVKRVLSFSGEDVSEKVLMQQPQPLLASKLDGVLEERFYGYGGWKDIPAYKVLMTLIRRRPRDLVKLCTLAARHANERGAQRIGTQDFMAIFEDYSQGRIQDAINEFRTELPEVDRLLMNMRPARKKRKTSEEFTFSNDELLLKIETIEQSGRFRFSTGKVATPVELVNFLYKINFITARKKLASGEIQRKFFEEQRYLFSQIADFGYQWEVHPAYRWALQPQDVKNLLLQVGVSADD